MVVTTAKIKLVSDNYRQSANQPAKLEQKKVERVAEVERVEKKVDLSPNRSVIFKRTIHKFAINQTVLCEITRKGSLKGKCQRVYPPQLSRWLQGVTDLHGASIEALELALDPEARDFYFNEIFSENLSLTPAKKK